MAGREQAKTAALDRGNDGDARFIQARYLDFAPLKKDIRSQCAAKSARRWILPSIVAFAK